MLLKLWAVKLAWCCQVVSGAQLFNGQPYIGSAEQHAEIDAITEAARARRVAYAAQLRANQTAIDLTDAINKNNAVSQPTVAEAHRMVDAAISRWATTYEPYVNSPRRNSYESRHSEKNKNKYRSRQKPAEPHYKRSSSSVDSSDSADFAAAASAAALLAELEAAERARSGTLYRNYTFDAPGSPIQQSKVQFYAATSNMSASGGSGAAAATYWLEQIAAKEHGVAPFAGDANYKVFRNVKDYGAKGDGVTAGRFPSSFSATDTRANMLTTRLQDDTAAINKAITDGKRCGADCLSSTTKPALVYFPAGTYLVSSTIIGYYQTQLVGNPNSRPTIRASSKFVGKDGTTGVISSDSYINGGGGQKWYLETSNFYRQVRNLIIDIQDVTAVNASCFHWQVAQATSIENVACYMSSKVDTTQRGIFCENGSGGWMADLEFSNGQIGIYGGEQQFTAVSIQFVGCKTAVQFIWDWGWTWRSIYVSGANVAFQLFDAVGGTENPGSFLLQDSIIANCKTGVLTHPPKEGAKSGTTNIILDTVAFSGVPSPVADTTGKVLLGGLDPLQVTQPWSLGNTFMEGASSVNTGGQSVYGVGTILTYASRPERLIAQAGDIAWSSKWYKIQRKPQYGSVDINSVINVRDYGAKGDGSADDTAAFQVVFSHAYRSGGIVFIPHGVYILSDTVELDVGVMVVGECWSQLMAKGSGFSNLKVAKPLIRVGIPGGSVGLVEMSDLIITSKGLAPNLVGLEWNIHGPNSGTVPGIYDVHVRIGGAVNTDLQVAQCPQGKGISCRAGLMMIHITPYGGGYFQNVWAWVADHDINDDFNDRVNVLVARGWLIESTEPVWLYGTATEHAVMYQYSFSSASTVSAGMIQTESGYFQGSNGVRNPAPFTGSNAISFPGDPVLPDGGCANGTISCDEAWAVVMLNSTNINIDGAGLYSWFNSYDESCVDSWNCQESMIQIGGDSGNVSVRNLITIGGKRMVSGTPNDNFLEVAAGPNLNANGHPWWSILSSFEIQNTVKTTVYPDHRNFFGLGDSYASGIGADCGKITEDVPRGQDCSKCQGAYAYQLAHHFVPFNGDGGRGSSSLFKFYACAGAKTSGIRDPPAPGKVSQIRQMKDYGNFRDFGFATLSIGGNDVGFSRIVKNCIFWHTGECDNEWARSERRISSADLVANLTQTYQQILDTAEEPTFKLFVTGYARFFNEYTDWCNNKNLFPNIFLGPRTKLTREVRARSNKLTENLNTVIEKTTIAVTAAYRRRNSQKSVIFVDVDKVYDGERWCDGNDRSSWRDDTYFFNAFSKDLKRDGTTAVDTNDLTPHVIDIGGINVNTCMDAADDANDDDFMTRCAIAMFYAGNSTAQATLGTIYKADDGNGPTLQIIDSGKFTTSAIGQKAFHPKTYALSAVAGRVFEAWIRETYR
ncbi:hypothetical protein Sste5344_010142 [Sporothrix stenoceras]